MTEKEILAELKMAYWYLQDINENHEDQITINEGENIRLSMQNLEILYRNLYKRIEKENKKTLFFKKDLLIGDQIYLDYVTSGADYDDQYITYKDLDNEEKWWEDYNFLTK